MTTTTASHDPTRLDMATDDSGQSRDASQMDDFEVIEERQRVMTALAALTSRYRQLNQEINRRETLRWMLAPR
jgi:hypothetical protein